MYLFVSHLIVAWPPSGFNQMAAAPESGRRAVNVDVAAVSRATQLQT